MQQYTKDFLFHANLLIDSIAHFRGNRRLTANFFENIEQTKLLMRVKDRLSHRPVLV